MHQFKRCPNLILCSVVTTTRTDDVCAKCCSWCGVSQCQPASLEIEKGSFLPPCSSNQSLPQVLNNYSVTRDAWHHNDRHNLILEAIVTVTKALLSPTAILTTDLYSFPLHIIVTDLRPDLVWWDEVHKSLCLAGLIVCYETNFVEAVQRKSREVPRPFRAGSAQGI